MLEQRLGFLRAAVIIVVISATISRVTQNLKINGYEIWRTYLKDKVVRSTDRDMGHKESV